MPCRKRAALLWLFIGAGGCAAGDKAESPPASEAPCEEGVWYADQDQDGYGGIASTACEAPEGSVELGGDCDDDDFTVYPGAPELCDGRDQDCDGQVDELLATSPAWRDLDGDGFGDPEKEEDVCAFTAEWVADSTDCDDNRAEVNPGASEVCDGLDNDCDGLMDDEDPSQESPPEWWVDTDGDGYGDPGSDYLSICAQPTGYADNDEDCDDEEAGINPSAEELCLDLIDQDCDGYEDDYTGECEAVWTAGGTMDACDETLAPWDVSACAEGVAALDELGEGFSTMQAAIDSATAGELISVCPGTWTEDLVQTVSPLVLMGYGEGISILEGAGHHALEMEIGGELTVMDLSIQGGTDDRGGGIYGMDATLCMSGVAMSENGAGSMGGAIYLGGSGGSFTADTLTLSNNKGGLAGGGLAIKGAYVVWVEDSDFLDNEAEQNGGGAYLTTEVAGTIAASTFEGNQVGLAGGGLAYLGDGPGLELALWEVDFIGNASQADGGALEVGDFWGTDTPAVRAFGGSFEGNEASGEGGAVHLARGSTTTFLAIGTDFLENRADMGGAIASRAYSAHTIGLEGCWLDGNAANGGGVLFLDPWEGGTSTTRLIESTLYRNTAETEGGAIMMVTSPPGVLLISEHSDWGTGPTNNEPDDLDNKDYGAGATFTCVDGACL